ncbi:dehydrogenase/reductase SDR family member 4-like 2 isoform X3 [Manis pentadactyla]|uniref:dehydrogenase/reductase SDR family member 4-like 2 isoform X3 n=1 Tax=Manis pentadactyla TaxID=143292 RepID=UPI00255CA674|nr:dehydrogenase/reductase SDR family member 4-like 2 isoform X3 [Manis pentadactyla]
MDLQSGCRQTGSGEGRCPPIARVQSLPLGGAEPTSVMQKAGLLLRGYTQAWKSVTTASSGMARREPLANKVALVTASTEGIGFAIARRLAQDGAHVVVSSRKQQNVDQAVATLQGEGLSVMGTVCHVGKAEDRERLVATALNLYGGIDILISNAAVSPFFGNLLDATEDVWDKILGINVKAAALMTKAVVPEMEKRGGFPFSVVVDGQGKRGEHQRNHADKKNGQARRVCRHRVFPVLRRRQLHHWRDSGSRGRDPIPPLRTWREPTRAEIGLQLNQFCPVKRSSLLCNQGVVP